MTCNWFPDGRKKCKASAKKKAYVSSNPKQGEPMIFPICEKCALLAPAAWKTKKIVAEIR